MGGRSFKCPLCEVWKTDGGALRDHAKTKHDVTLDFSRGGPYPVAIPKPSAAISTQEDLDALCTKHGTEDPHRARAAEEFGVHVDCVTREQRDVAKQRNFPILYGSTGKLGDALKGKQS